MPRNDSIEGRVKKEHRLMYVGIFAPNASLR